MLKMLFNLLFLAACLQVQSSHPRSKFKAVGVESARKIYANPFHPEDDKITALQDFMTDEDGDNLHSLRDGQLSETEKKIIKVKRLKVNGRYYTVGKNTEHIASEEI